MIVVAVWASRSWASDKNGVLFLDRRLLARWRCFSALLRVLTIVNTIFALRIFISDCVYLIPFCFFPLFFFCLFIWIMATSYAHARSFFSVCNKFKFYSWAILSFQIRCDGVGPECTYNNFVVKTNSERIESSAISTILFDGKWTKTKKPRELFAVASWFTLCRRQTTTTTKSTRKIIKNKAIVSHSFGTCRCIHKESASQMQTNKKKIPKNFFFFSVKLLQKTKTLSGEREKKKVRALSELKQKRCGAFRVAITNFSLLGYALHIASHFHSFVFNDFLFVLFFSSSSYLFVCCCCCSFSFNVIRDAFSIDTNFNLMFTWPDWTNECCCSNALVVVCLCLCVCVTLIHKTLFSLRERKTNSSHSIAHT